MLNKLNIQNVFSSMTPQTTDELLDLLLKDNKDHFPLKCLRKSK